MTVDPLAGLAIILILAIGAQWLAWRIHLPSILLLLVAGIIAGPVTGFLNPDRIFGDLLLPLISISVAIILFEGGLSLSIADLKEIGGIVRNLITIGVLVSWLIISAAAHLILRFSLPLAVLLGAILVVTGPTVIIPLLTHIRPVGQVGSVIKWEGMLNDPIGAVLAVLVFEVISVSGLGTRGSAFLLGLLEVLIGGIVIGSAGALLMIFLLRRYWIPDFLHGGVSLMMVVAVLTAANRTIAESGLLAVTIMGIALANQRVFPVKHIVEFKENLRVLLIGGLFVLLAARLSASDLFSVDVRSLLFLGVLLFVARPVAVALSTIRSELSWRQRLFLSWMAPRGIVAAAVSAIFAARLTQGGYPDARRLVSETFLIIIGTVTVYSLSAFPIARWLRLSDVRPQGALIVGAHSWAREIASVLKEEGYEVVLVDSTWPNISAARLKGFRTHFGAILSEHVLGDINLYGIGRLMALTANDEANSLAALHFADIFGRAEVYQLPPEGLEDKKRKLISPLHLSGRFLFGSEITHSFISEQFQNGASVKATKFSDKFDYEAFLQRHERKVVPLFLITKTRDLVIYTTNNQPVPRTGQTLISLLLRPQETEAAGQRTNGAKESLPA